MENRKPTILKKSYQKESITRTDKGTDETITKSEESTETINSFFTIMIDNLKIEYYIDRQVHASTHSDSVFRPIEHLNITKVY